VLDPKSASRQAGTLYVLKNAEEFNKGTVTDRTAVGIRATGDNTLVMTLKERTGNLLAQVAGYPAFWPVPQAIVEKNGDKWIEAGTFVGNGPFTIKEWSHNERMVLVPNPSYWAKKPALDRVEVKLLQDPNTGGLPGFEAAELDFASVPAGEIPRIRGGNLAPLLKFAPVPQLWAVFPDAGHKPWDDVRVRQAFYLALDRDKLSAAFNGLMTPAYILTPQTVPGNTKDLRPLTGSAADAKRLLAEAGYPNGVGFPSVTLTTQTSSDAVLFGQAAQSMWKDTLGVTVKISALERQTFSSFSNSMKTVPYDLVLNGGLADIPDPWLFLDFMIGSDGLGYYATRWKDPQYAELLPIARNEADQTKRIALYQQLEKIIIGQAGVIPWANQNLAYVTKPNISGLRIGFGTNVPVLKEINVTN
jgi:oligopeptide transport system substrate-binding protein